MNRDAKLLEDKKTGEIVRTGCRHLAGAEQCVTRPQNFDETESKAFLRPNFDENEFETATGDQILMTSNQRPHFD